MTNLTIITKIGTKPRPRFAKIGGFVRTYTPKTALTYERYIASEYQRLGGKWYEENPLNVQITFWFKAPENTPKFKLYGIKERLVPCATHKDLDNLAKAVLDSLNGVAYKDDKQIVSLHIHKKWTDEQERIEIQMFVPTYPNDTILKDQYNDYKRNNRA